MASFDRLLAAAAVIEKAAHPFDDKVFDHLLHTDDVPQGVRYSTFRTVPSIPTML
jgi:hypothetical protein